MPAELPGSPGLVVVEVDPWDDDLLARWHAVHDASQRHGRADTASPFTLPEATESLRLVTDRSWRSAWAGVRDGEVVAAARLTAPLLDNVGTVMVEIDVRPDARAQGIGSALLGHLEEVCRTRGITVLQAEVAWAHDDPAGDRSADLAFARRHGFTLGLVDVQRVLRLPVAAGVLDRLQADAAPHHASYDVRAWVGPVPDDLVDGWAALAGSLMVESPTGEMDREVEALDAAGVRESEALVAAQGRTKYNAVALSADGEVVAYTDIATTVHEPGLSYQWGTLVRRDHRGHRLGTAVKLANLRLLQDERPDITTVRTWNAEVNEHMIAVNAALGFEPVERLGELQKRLV